VIPRSRETRGPCFQGDTGQPYLPSFAARLERRSTVKSSKTTSQNKTEEVRSFIQYQISERREQFFEVPLQLRSMLFEFFSFTFLLIEFISFGFL